MECLGYSQLETHGLLSCWESTCSHVKISLKSRLCGERGSTEMQTGTWRTRQEPRTPLVSPALWAFWSSPIIWYRSQLRHPALYCAYQHYTLKSPNGLVPSYTDDSSSTVRMACISTVADINKDLTLSLSSWQMWSWWMDWHWKEAPTLPTRKRKES